MKSVGRTLAASTPVSYSGGPEIQICYRNFRQFFYANGGTAPQIWAEPLSYKFLPIRYLLNIMPFYVIQSEESGFDSQIVKTLF
jgi:hypothetical protein